MRLSLTAMVAVFVVAISGCARQSSQPAASPTVSPAASSTVVTTTSSPEKHLTRTELQDILNGFGGLDGVELKMTIDDSDRQSVVKALDMDPLEGELRQVIFFDTKDLALNRAGVVVRARRIHSEDGDSVIKLRPVAPAQVPPRLRAIPTFKVELDVMPERYVTSASFEREDIDDKDLKAVLAKRKPIQDLFSPEQRAFYSEHAPKGVSLDSLSVLGPINALRLKFEPAGLSRKLVAELWTYPDGSRVLELSTTCKPEETLVATQETMAYLNARGVKPGTAQQTKTRTALEYFTKLQ